MSGDTHEAILQWLLSLYQAAQETPIEHFKDEVFQRVNALIPLSSGIWADVGHGPGGRFDCFGIHLHNAPSTLGDELIEVNQKFRVSTDLAFARPGRAHSFYSYGMARDNAQVRDYLRRFGHQNLLISLDTASPGSRGEFFSLYRSRCEDHFTPAEQSLMSLLLPHVIEALAIARELSTVTALPEAASLSGTRALVQTDGVMLTCGERFKAMLRRRWPDWFTGRLPRELMEQLRPGVTFLPVEAGAIALSTKKLGPYLFIEARPQRSGAVLTARENQIAQLFASGQTYRQIASAIALQPATVRNVLQRVYGKLQISSKAGLVRVLKAGPPAA